MPVRVDIPTRLRVDAPALDACREELAEALGAAAARALAGSRRVVLDPGPATAQVRLNPPVVSWFGDGLDEVSPALRLSVERMVADVVGEAARSAGVAAGEVPPLSGPEEAVAERLDPERFDPVLDLYEIPSYGGGGAARKVRTKQSDAPGPAPRPVVPVISWRPIEARDSGRIFRETLADLGIEPPAAGYLGAILMLEGAGPAIFVDRYPAGQTVLRLGIQSLHTIDYDPARGWITVPARMPPDAGYSLGLVAVPGAAAEAALSAFFEPVVRTVMLRFRKPLVSRAEFEQSVADRVRVVVAAQLALTSKPKSWLRLDIGPTPFLLGVDNVEPIPSDLADVRLIPLVAWHEGSVGAPAGKGETTGGGQGQGAPAVRAGEGAAGEQPAATAEPVAAPPRGTPGLIDIGRPAAEDATRLFPRAPQGLATLELTCEPFLGEPHLDELGEIGVRMRDSVAAISHALQIPACDYAGRFLLNAAAALGARAVQVTLWRTSEEATTSAAPAGAGNLGTLQFIPVPSAQIQFLRHLATVTPRVSDLAEWIAVVYREQPEKITGTWRGRALSWLLRFNSDLNGLMAQNVGEIFAMTCQVLFLQLLNASHRGIQDRLDTLPAFARHFEAVIVPQLAGVDELLHTRELLKNARMIQILTVNDPQTLRARWPDVRMATQSPVSSKPPAAASWRQAADDFAASLAPTPAPTPAPEELADHYEIVPQVDRSYRILDRHGRVWGMDDLETAIALRRGSLEAAEPLVKQLTDIPEVMARFRRRGASVEAELRSLLDEMRASNEDIAARARDELRYAFEKGAISESIQGATVPGTSYALHGIHLQAHQQVGEFFGGDGFYALGVEHAFDVELGSRELVMALEFTGLVLLAVLCPPLAVEVGIGVAAYHYGEARERERVYEALIDPEEVLTRAEVEAQLFATELGLALSFLPIAGEIAAEARAVLSVAARAGAEAGEAALAAGSRRVALTAAQRAAQHLAQVIERGVMTAFVEEMGKAYLINKAVEAALAPVMEHLQREWKATGPVGGVEGALSALLEQARRRRLAATPPSQAATP